MSNSYVDPRVTDRTKPAAERPSLPSAVDPRVVRFLEKLATGNFFGKVVMAFQNGKVMDVRVEQTRKLDEL